MEENNCNRGAQSRLPLVGPGDQNLIRKETLAAGRFAPGLQAHSSMRKCSRQNLLRNWQNGKLWWNDPDAVTLSGAMPMEEYRFHAGAIMASGGLVISGDDLCTLPADLWSGRTYGRQSTMD